MNKKELFSKGKTIKGKLVALVFFLIAVGGMILFINSFSDKDDSRSSENTEQKVKNEEQKAAQDTGGFYGKFEGYKVDTENTDKARIEQKSEGIKKGKNSKSSSYSSFVLKTIIIIIVLLLVLIFYIYYRKNYTKAGDSSNQINIIGRSYIGKNQYLLIVECGGSKMLLGVTEHNINLIKEFDNDEENDLEIESDQNAQNQSGFGNILQKLQ